MKTCKRGLDIGLSLTLLILLAPLMLATMWLVRRDGGPALYRHIRIGKAGRSFSCLKFRSMVPDGAGVLEGFFSANPGARERWEAERKLESDPRITPLGAVIRKFSIDELPQLWNVLRGEMSLVGPRPIPPEELAKYGASAPDYLSVRPGITGPWQVSGRSGLGYSARVQIDAQYVREWSLARDFVILARTPKAVLLGAGAG